MEYSPRDKREVSAALRTVLARYRHDGPGPDGAYMQDVISDLEEILLDIESNSTPSTTAPTARSVKKHSSGKPQLIGMSGFARSGKDTASEYLKDIHGYDMRAIATPLKNILPKVDEYVAHMVDDYGWEKAKERMKVREGLQRLGATLREEFGQDFLPLMAMGKITKDTLLVVSDIRTHREVEIIREHGGLVVRVERPGVGPANADVTEAVVDYDYLVENNGTLEELYFEIEKIIYS